MICANLHSHTTFSDGKNTVAEMAEAAYRAGLGVFGFSEHSWTPQFADYPGLVPEQFEDYRRAVLEARERYAGKMRVYLGLEQDTLSPPPPDGLDYLIGSLHYLEYGGEYLSVDGSAGEQRDAVERHFGGDYYAFAREYYRQEALLLEKTGAQIVGHFDLVTIYNEGGILFDENDRRYRDAAFSALDALLERDPVIEINTGAISRGYRTSPYPSEPLLRRVREKGGRITFSSDTHAVGTVTGGFAEGAALARACGFMSYWTLSGEPGTFVEVPWQF